MKLVLLLTLILSTQAYAQDDNNIQSDSEHQEIHGQEEGKHGGGYRHKGERTGGIYFPKQNANRLNAFKQKWITVLKVAV